MWNDRTDGEIEAPVELVAETNDTPPKELPKAMDSKTLRNYERLSPLTSTY